MRWSVLDDLGELLHLVNGRLSLQIGRAHV